MKVKPVKNICDICEFKSDCKRRNECGNFKVCSGFEMIGFDLHGNYKEFPRGIYLEGI